MRPRYSRAAAGLHEVEPGALEEFQGVFLQPALGGDGNDKRLACRGPGAVHAAAPVAAATRSIQIEAPTAGTS